MHIVIYGTGGVGGYFGGKLALSGEDVTFIARGAHLEGLRTNGLQVRSVKGDFTLPTVHATDDPSEVGVADVVLVTTKAWQVAEAARSMAPMVGDNTIVVPLQNGVEAPAQLAEVFGPDRVLGGLCWIVSFIVGPGIIQHTGVEPHVVFGRMDRRRGERVEQLYRALAKADVHVDVSLDIQAAMWEKFTFISTVSGIGAITRMPIGVTRSVPQTRQMIEHAIDEVMAVAWGQGVSLEKAVFDRTMAFIDGMPPGSTFSMQRDITEGRPSELEAQNGAVVRLGQEVEVVTPIHQFIYHSLLPLEMQARGKLE